VPEREYFSLRYAVPGFIIILIIVGLNYSPIVETLKPSGPSDIFGVVISFLSLFAGSAIGFLVAQFWFGWFNWRRIDAKRVYKRHLQIMKDKFRWRPENDLEDKDNASVLSAVLDYMLLYEKDNNKWGYCQRKWDIYHILSCSLISLIIGFSIGLPLRIAFNYWIFSSSSILDFSALNTQTKTDVLLFMFTLLSVIVFLILVFLTRRQIFNEYHKMLDIFVNHMAGNEKFLKELKDTFPDHFEDKKKS
jgi:prepilin signal peptidase PulO-like enzyme (type II secretory pathway)